MPQHKRQNSEWALKPPAQHKYQQWSSSNVDTPGSYRSPLDVQKWPPWWSEHTVQFGPTMPCDVCNNTVDKLVSTAARDWPWLPGLTQPASSFCLLSAAVSSQFTFGSPKDTQHILIVSCSINYESVHSKPFICAFIGNAWSCRAAWCCAANYNVYLCLSLCTDVWAIFPASQ